MIPKKLTHRIFKRKIRSRQGTAEIVVPPPIVSYLIDKNKPKKYEYIAMWLDKDWKMVIAGFPVSYNDIHGISLQKQLYRHGGSWAFSIPDDVYMPMKNMRDLKRIDSMKIRVNPKGHIEYEPIVTNLL